MQSTPRKQANSQELVLRPVQSVVVAQEPPPTLREFRPLESLRRKPLLALLSFLLCAVVGGVVALHKGAPVYHAEALVFVSPTLVRTTMEEQPRDYSYDTFVNHNTSLARTHDVLAEAVKRLGEDSTPWQAAGEGTEQAVARLRSALVIERVPNTYQLSIGVAARFPEGLAAAANRIAEVFVEKVNQDEEQRRADRRASLETERASLESMLEKELASKIALVRAAGGVSESSAADRMKEAITRDHADLASARRRRLEAEAQLASLGKAMGAQDIDLLQAIVQEVTQADPGLTAIKVSLNQRRAGLYQQIAGLKEKNPLRQSAEAELADIDKQLQTSSEELTMEVAKQLRYRMRIERDNAAFLEKQMQANLERLSVITGESTKDLMRATESSAQIETLRARINGVDERLRVLRVANSEPPVLQVTAPARDPLQPDQDGRKKWLMAAMLAALMVGLFAPSVLDVADTRIREPEDVTRVLGFPPIGIVLEETEEVCPFADVQIQRIVTAIENAARCNNVRTILVTSVRSGGGSTTLIEKLGTRMVEVGLRTVVVDADHLNDPSSAGPNVKAASMNVTSTTRDVMMIDAAPLLVAPQTESLARVTDLTLLVVEANHVRMRELLRVANRLETLQLPCLGVVLNRVRMSKADRDLWQDRIDYMERLRRKYPGPDSATDPMGQDPEGSFDTSEQTTV